MFISPSLFLPVIVVVSCFFFFWRFFIFILVGNIKEDAAVDVVAVAVLVANDNDVDEDVELISILDCGWSPRPLRVNGLLLPPLAVWLLLVIVGGLWWHMLSLWWG